MRAKARRAVLPGNGLLHPCVGEAYEGLGAGEVIEQLLRLALEEHIVFGFADESGAGNSFGHSIAEVETESGGEIGAWCGCSHGVHAVGEGPVCGG